MNDNIKNWAVEDRPREKLARIGKKGMTDAELLAIILGSGSKNQSALKLARKVMLACNNNTSSLARLSAKELCSFNGIGPAKAISVLSAVELGRRTTNNEGIKLIKVKSSKDAYLSLRNKLDNLPHEEFWILILNRGNMIIDKRQISKGGISGTVADVRLIYKEVIEQHGCAIIVAHNHPSGNMSPSKADISLTKKIKEAGKILDVELLDHLIIVEGSYLSFADEGIL